MHEIFGLKHVFSTLQETVWSHLKSSNKLVFFTVMGIWYWVSFGKQNTCIKIIHSAQVAV